MSLLDGPINDPYFDAQDAEYSGSCAFWWENDQGEKVWCDFDGDADGVLMAGYIRWDCPDCGYENESYVGD